MAISAWVLLLGIAVAQTSSSFLPQAEEEFIITQLQSAVRHAPPTPLQITDNVINLKRANSVRSISSGYVQALRRQARGSKAVSSNSTTLISAEAGSVFLTPVTVGGQNFDVVVDTGSSDPWLVIPEYTCIDLNNGQPQPESGCYFGPAYNSSASSTFAVLPKENFNISYADGEVLSGSMGYDSFTLGGITVPQQEFALVNYAAWQGDEMSSGLVGFAYSTLTSAHPGTDPTQDQQGQTVMYNPLFTSMYTNLGVPPVFSLAIDRDPNNGGVLAIGGIPDVPHSPYFATTPILPLLLNSSTGQPVYEYYSITVQGYAVARSPSAQFNVLGNKNSKKVSLMENGTQAIVDSGTSLVYAPNDVAAAVAAAFSPSGYYDEDAGVYFVSCSAKTPQFGVAIGKKIFFVNPLDMVLQTQTGCISGVQSDQNTLTILGDVWMKNIIAVFDIGAEQMRFAAREFYGLRETSVSATT